ncbi:diacylglycerol kinase family protein [Neobacillus piezotolerans]|uniref:Diacylglycerol kinase family protein n=1 Tax=Neobacillus piezotolerans TaxID=2259171 RepID=A0A3D8GLR9_9BACI|nr:diacylglycerol kinase family protein [Neobacillus piezotolerans]RDU35415.1 diacylglycerol kinase family protein [Neobacillus piezotolerans]
MDSGLPGNGRGPGGRLLKSFVYALSGIGSAIKRERNLQIHIFAGTVAIGLSILFSISKMEWLFILLAIAGMLSLELLNTAVERVVDLVTEEFHPIAKQAKDIAAGAVLVYACLSLLIGAIIFLPKITLIFGR